MRSSYVSRAELERLRAVAQAHHARHDGKGRAAGPQAHARPEPRRTWRSARLWTFAAAGAFLLFAGLFAAAVVGFAIYNSYVDGFVPPDRVAINQPSLGAKIYDRNGRLLYEYVDERDGLREPVPLDAVSEAFLAATIATEDRSFFSNPGVSIRGLARAAWENFSPISDTPGFLEGSGGSSITQQLVKNVYIPYEERSDRSIDRKLKETIYAIEITRRYSKEQVLAWYVNQISYGSIYNGVEAASQGYFGKPAGELTLAEAALLAGIPQSPATYDPRNNAEAALNRRNEVLDSMLDAGDIQVGDDRHVRYSAEEIAAAKQEPLAISEGRFPILAPHFVLTYVEPQLEQIFGPDAVYRMGLSVHTTLDLDQQEEAHAALERWISEFEDISASRNGALMVIEPTSGEIRVMIGSRDYFREDIDGTVNNLLAVNSPGSSFKPFVYLASFLKLGWGPATILQDTPVSYREADGSVFQPQNPTVGSYQGNITLRNSLGNSLNVPAFKTAQAVGVSEVVAAARRFGFTTLNGYYGPAIAIGGVDLAAVDLTYAYAMLANGGVMVGLPVEPDGPAERKLDPIAVMRVEDATGETVWDIRDHRGQERVVPEEQAFLITSILSDPSAVCITFGCGGLNIPGYSAAVKTGTSSPFDPSGPNRNKIGDTWAFGYTRDWAVGVWAGNSDNSPIVNIYSTSISYRAMRDTMLALYDGGRQTPLQVPSNIERRSSCDGRSSGQQCVEDYFVRLQPDAVRNAQARLTPTPAPNRGGSAGSGGAAISSPGGGSVSGVVAISGSASTSGMQFYRLEFGRGESPTAWSSIGQWSLPVSGGQLAAWDTTPLAPGPYTLRLTVQGPSGPVTTSVVVNVVDRAGIGR